MGTAHLDRPQVTESVGLSLLTCTLGVMPGSRAGQWPWLSPSVLGNRHRVDSPEGGRPQRASEVCTQALWGRELRTLWKTREGPSQRSQREN